MSIAPTRFLSVAICTSALLTAAAAFATIAWHAEELGLAGGLVALLLLGLVRRWVW